MSPISDLSYRPRTFLQLTLNTLWRNSAQQIPGREPLHELCHWIRAPDVETPLASSCIETWVAYCWLAQKLATLWFVCYRQYDNLWGSLVLMLYTTCVFFTRSASCGAQCVSLWNFKRTSSFPWHYASKLTFSYSLRLLILVGALH